MKIIGTPCLDCHGFIKCRQLRTGFHRKTVAVEKAELLVDRMKLIAHLDHHRRTKVVKFT